MKKFMIALLALVALWVLTRIGWSCYQDAAVHSFERAGIEQNKHKLLHGNFYFYFKKPVKPTYFKS